MNWNYINIAFFKKGGIKYKARLNREVKGSCWSWAEYWWSPIPKQIQPSFQDSFLLCVHVCVCLQVFAHLSVCVCARMCVYVCVCFLQRFI